MTTIHHEADCYATWLNCGKHAVGEPRCGGTWQCDTCGRLFGYCHGGYSDTDTEQENESCDECWAHIKAMKGECDARV